MFEDDKEAPNPHKGDMCTYRYGGRLLSGLIRQRSGYKVLVEPVPKRQAWIDIGDVVSVDATAAALKDAKAASDAAAQRLDVFQSAAQVHEARAR